MRIDVVIPTFNREELLRRTLESLLAAKRPEGLDLRVTVVDNDSTDGTRMVVQQFQPRFDGRLAYLLETRRGRSNALNAGVASGSGDFVGMIDDDEEVCAEWFVAIKDSLSNNKIDFLGGPCLPRWGADPPVWLPRTHRGVIGWVENESVVTPYGRDSVGILMGGNSVIRRAVLEKVGGYSAKLGRSEKHLLSCEDEEMYQRLLDAGATGLYLPSMAIYHYVPPERLTRAYHRRWSFWRGASLGVLDRERPSPVKYLFGVPRYLFGNAARGFIGVAKGLFGGSNASDRFSRELAVWDLAGFFYGKHFFRAGKPAGGEAIGGVSPASTSNSHF
jgi:glycosyltransferase involved in cell wall biosynthesis